MLRLVERCVEDARSGAAAIVGAVAPLEEHERQAVEGFIENPNTRNVNTIATYVSAESTLVEQTLASLPNAFVWKQDGKWHLLVDE